MTKKTLYGNYKMLSIDGKFLAYVDEKRVKWYLSRGLGVMINAKEIKLNFKTKGDEIKNSYYKVELKCICVVCGSSENLTKHHVIPLQYRKHLPLNYKSRNSYDVLLLCVECHEDYELHANELKNELLNKYGLINYTKNVIKVKKTINALKNYNSSISEEKKELMIEFIEEFLNQSFEEILKYEGVREYKNGSKLLINQVNNYNEFIIMWRKHFIKMAKPQFLPKEWVKNIKNV